MIHLETYRHFVTLLIKSIVSFNRFIRNVCLYKCTQNRYWLVLLPFLYMYFFMNAFDNLLQC